MPTNIQPTAGFLLGTSTSLVTPIHAHPEPTVRDLLGQPTRDMAPKRTRDGADPDHEPARKKRAFTVGPANLPDGTYRRKAKKIKANLIQKAKLKKSYEKVKAQELASTATAKPSYLAQQDQSDDNAGSSVLSSTGPARHPDRQAIVDDSHSQQRGPQNGEDYESKDQGNGSNYEEDDTIRRRDGRRLRRSKPYPFAKEESLAQKRREEAEAKQKLRDLKDKERAAMTRARKPDQFGKRRLGRESKALLQKVQRIIGEN
ncbi:hypothetical protein FQN57_003875 [Myotisia sp. PD_48]|nr:hypothetical protein FQN57_003875 [Myotisia sp. PD_48]